MFFNPERDLISISDHQEYFKNYYSKWSNSVGSANKNKKINFILDQNQQAFSSLSLFCSRRLQDLRF